MRDIMLAPPRYPARESCKIGERPDAIDDLVKWVKGGTFHEYGVPSQAMDGYDPLENPSLNFAGNLVDGRLRWSVSFSRYGLRWATGLAAGHAHEADAAYAALHLIEEGERERYLRDVVGVAGVV